MTVRPAKTQISLGIDPVWSESSLCAQWVAKNLRFLHADSEDTDQTGQTPRLIWVFVERTATLLVLSCRSSCYGTHHWQSRITLTQQYMPSSEWHVWNELENDKVNKMACVPSKDSDQPAHPYPVWWHLKMVLYLPAWSESSLRAQDILLALSWFGSNPRNLEAVAQYDSNVELL